jgi:S-adenosylmethionine decarboxylase
MSKEHPGERFMVLGRRLLIEFWSCDYSILNNKKKIKQLLYTAAQVGGANLINLFVHKFSPHGITGTATLSESHICIHTWPEYRYAAIDIFMCGKCNPYLSLEFLESVLYPESTKITEVISGIPSEEARYFERSSHI